MKYFRQVCATLILMLILTGAAFAGDIQFPVAAPSPPGGTPNETMAVHPVMEVMLNLFQMLSLS